jgi:hypothetical protein
MVDDRSHGARRPAGRTTKALLGLAGLGGVAAAGAVAWAVVQLPTPGASDPPRFVEEATAAGLRHTYDGGYPFFVGGGAAAFDCDDDGKQELYFAGGSNPAGLYRNRSPIGGPLRFDRLSDPATDLEAVLGAYPLDVDGDARTDLAVLRLGENVLLRGLGDCRFENANDAWGIDGGDAWTAAFSATWEAAATLPTLAFGNYVVLDEDQRPTDACEDSVLVRPAGSSGGYAEPIRLRPSWCTLSMLFSDWNRSGRRDLRLTNDRHYYPDREGEEQLWRVPAGEPPRLYAREEGWARMLIWGMGIASQDLTGDGLPEVFLTSQADNKLQTLADGPARPAYEDIALERAATAHRPFTGGDILPSTAWHAEFQDVNNDAFMDLFIAKGNVEAQPDYATRDPSNLLLGQADGTFVERAEEAGILSYARARGAALVDLNLDGMLDLVVVNRRENVKLWRNVGWGDATEPRPMGGWLAIRLEQAGPNRDAIGAWVEVRAGDRTIEREVTVGGGHAGGQLGWIHFGLGMAASAELRVQWPDGEVGPWQPVEGGTFVIVERGAPEALRWEPE